VVVAGIIQPASVLTLSAETVEKCRRSNRLQGHRHMTIELFRLAASQRRCISFECEQTRSLIAAAQIFGDLQQGYPPVIPG
jgi:hypothetical protein